MSKAKRIHGALALTGVFLCFAPVSCKPPAKTPAAAENPLAHQLAGARVDAAKLALDQNHRDEALLLLVSALKAEPDSLETLQLLRPLLAGTRWHFPVVCLESGLPVTQLSISGNSLWTSLSGSADGFDTTARWNLKTTAIEAVLFPRRAEETTAAVLSPTAEKIILQRGKPGDRIALLCDAKTLRPITNLGGFPENCDPAAVTVFSDDGLLFAHPEASPKHLIWHLRDAATGEIIRSSEQPIGRQPVGARFDGDKLVVHHSDGSILEIPLSPVDEPFLQEGENPASPPAAAFQIIEQNLTFSDPSRSGIRADFPITAATIDDSRAILGFENGSVEIHQLLPLPKTSGVGMEPIRFNPAGLNTLAHLAEALGGLRFDEENRSFRLLTEADRRAALNACDAKQLPELLPGLDFSMVRNTVLVSPFRVASSEATFLLRDRLIRAESDRPRYLALATTKSPEASPHDRLEALFKEGDSEKILAAIQALPSKSPAIPTALALAIDSDRSVWIDAALKAAPDAPPMIKRLALSRIAWIEGSKAEAMAFWPDGFPDVESLRRSEDWDGWEATNFPRRFTELFTAMREEMNGYEIPENASPKDRKIIAKRLLDPASSRSLGRDRHAAACLDAAFFLAEFPEEKDLVAKLTIFARQLGAPPAKCLRADATALTKAGEFAKAHESWVSLISDFPTETHESGDYAEAAYTAFENGNSGQAMAILGTGVFRFPRDPNFAYRAGWISLLTGQWQEAYEFLRAGEKVGFPEEKREKATALLAIASATSGNTLAAGNYYDQLIAIDPAWSQPAPPKADGWPEELVATLHELSEPPKAIPVSD